MKFDLGYLLGLIEEHFQFAEEYHMLRLEMLEKQLSHMRKRFQNENDYRKFLRKSTLYVDHLEGDDAVRFAKACTRYETRESLIDDFCRVFGLDMQKLFSETRQMMKWMKKHNWRLTYPLDKHEEQILASIVKKAS